MRVVALVVGVATLLHGIPPRQALAVDAAYAALAYPVPPCAGAPSPDFPKLGEPPVIRVWRDGEIRGWRPAECVGFGPLDTNTAIATAGRFRIAGGIDALADRVARVSALTTIRFYSVRDEEWQPLFVQAYALGEGAYETPVQARRPDFTAADIQTGFTTRFWKEENSLLSPVVYRLAVRERTPDRLVYTIVNENVVKALFLRAIEPGELRQLYVIERDPDSASGDVWRYYSLVEARTRTGPFRLSARSYINRAGAYYRYMAGIPTDLEPPPARERSE